MPQKDKGLGVPMKNWEKVVETLKLVDQKEVAGYSVVRSEDGNLTGVVYYANPDGSKSRKEFSISPSKKQKTDIDF